MRKSFHLSKSSRRRFLALSWTFVLALSPQAAVPAVARAAASKRVAAQDAVAIAVAPSNKLSAKFHDPTGAASKTSLRVPQATTPFAVALISLSDEFIQPAFVYHYGYHGKLGQTNPAVLRMSAGDFVQAELAGAQTSFLDNPNTGGYYVAIDPVVSRAWGNALPGDSAVNDFANFVMTRLQITAQTRVIHQDKMDTPFGAAVVKWLSEQSCRAKSLREMTAPPECRAIFLQTTHDLGIKGYAYTWGSSPLAGCAVRPATAFVFFDSEIAAKNDLLSFDKNLSSSPAVKDEQARIESLFRDARARLFQSPTVLAAMRPWPALDAAGDPQNMESWKQTNLIGCGKIFLRAGQ